ncbi:DUF6508 domain-containing protein [Nocardioides sp. NBC_00163]|uniref:DUF6508 domain-containing protein n=1 Tax=Nocardioides sp. NBC_00163 TaxID=2975999 RepID=UPI00324F606B
MPDATWLEAFEAADALTAEDRDFAWGGGQKTESGAIQMPYPAYSDRVRQLYRSLPGASIDWMKWMRGNPLLSDPSLLTAAPIADAARLATVYTRGERFNDGVFGHALQDGSIDAIVGRLRTWFESER